MVKADYQKAIIIAFALKLLMALLDSRFRGNENVPP
jgi:hypothetical protein